MYNELKTVETTVLYVIFNIIMIPDENDWCCINVNLSIKLAVQYVSVTGAMPYLHNFLNVVANCGRPIIFLLLDVKQGYLRLKSYPSKYNDTMLYIYVPVF